MAGRGLPTEISVRSVEFCKSRYRYWYCFISCVLAICGLCSKDILYLMHTEVRPAWHRDMIPDHICSQLAGFVDGFCGSG